jgi:hypothetical protein
METKQTAVEWLIKEMTSGKLFDWRAVFEQAKQIEKEQIIEAHEQGWDAFLQERHYNATYGKGYYNETYNKTK